MKTFNKAYAEYYDLFYLQKDYKHEAEYIINLLQDYGIYEGNIVDFGCGTGNHDFYLAQNNYSVLGIDISEEMIIRAKENYRDNENLEFLVGDFRDIKLESKFGIAISLFHVISYQNTYEQLIDCLNSVRHSLEKGGYFIFDFWNGAGVLMDKPTNRIKRAFDNEKQIVRFTESEINVNKNLVSVKFEVSVKNIKTKVTETFTETHIMRYWFLPELDYILLNNGFEVINCYQWLTKDSPTANSWYGVMVAKKI